MEIQKITAEELRKSIYDPVHNPQHKKFLLDIISQKLGKQNLAYILMVLASILYPLGFLFTNEHKFNAFETSLMRGMVTILINYLIVRHYNIEIDFKDPYNFKILFFRNLIMALQGVVYAIIQFYLTQPIIQTLNSTGTLFIFLLDYKINGVTISRKQLYGVVFGILGVLLTVNGEIIIHYINPDYTTTTQFKNYSTDNPIYKFLGALAFVGVQFLWAYGQIITKTLHQVNSIQINFHLGISILISSAIIYPIQVSNPVPIGTFVQAIFASGLLMVTGQICFVGAITMTKNTGVLTMLCFVSVIVGYFVSIFKYKQQINPFCTIGTILIVFGLAKILLKGNVEKQAEVKGEIQKK